MDPAIYILLAILICMVPVLAKTISDVRKKIDRNSDRVIVVETKLDIFLEHTGFDLNKVNRAIKDHMDELKLNDKPTVGCINVKGLYKN